MSNLPLPSESPYRSILVHVDVNDGAASRVRLAANLADKWGSFLIGAAAIEQYLSLYGDGTMLTPGLFEQEKKRTDDFLAATGQTFRRETAGLRTTDWHTELWNETSVIVDQARRADMIVLGQKDVQDRTPGVSTLSVAEVIVSSGRPVLIVPPNVDELPSAKVVIGWKDSREVRRAISDALPLLRLAQEITVVAVSPTLEGEAWAEVQGYLARHRLPCSFVYRREQETEAARIILDTARMIGAGLIVTGAYGHRRLSEWLFGGVTRELSFHSPVCCLMSH